MAYMLDSLLDETGWKILEALQRDARIPLVELGRLVGLSRPAVTERVKRLEEAGIITGYSAQINLGRVGLPIMAFMRVRSSEGRCSRLAEAVEQIPEVLECYHVTGDDDLIAKVAVSSVPHLEAVIEKLTVQNRVTTLLVLSPTIENRPITLELVTHEEPA